MDSWQTSTAFIGKLIHEFSVLHEELKPLKSAFINFARKYCVDGKTLKGAAMGVNLKRVRTVLTAFEQTGLVVIDKADHARLIKTVDRQQEEIEALELRIKRLIETPSRKNQFCIGCARTGKGL